MGWRERVRTGEERWKEKEEEGKWREGGRKSRISHLTVLSFGNRTINVTTLIPKSELKKRRASSQPHLKLYSFSCQEMNQLGQKEIFYLNKKRKQIPRPAAMA